MGFGSIWPHGLRLISDVRKVKIVTPPRNANTQSIILAILTHRAALAPPTPLQPTAHGSGSPAPTLAYAPLGSTLTTYPSSHSRIRRKKSPTKQTRSDLPAEDDDWQALRASCEGGGHLGEGGAAAPQDLQPSRWQAAIGAPAMARPRCCRARSSTSPGPSPAHRGLRTHVGSPTHFVSNLVAQSWYDTVILHRDRQRHHAHQQRQDL